MKYTLTAPTINATIEGAVSVWQPGGGTTFCQPLVDEPKGVRIRKALRAKS